MSGAPALPPELQNALPPGEPGARLPPRPTALPALRKRVLDKGGEYWVSALLPEPLSLRRPATRAWLEGAMDAADTRLLGLMLARSRQQAYSGHDDLGDALVHWLALQHGVGAAFDALLHAARWRSERGGVSTLRQDLPLDDDDHAFWGQPQSPLWQLRGHWVLADADTRAACIGRMRELEPQLPLMARARFAIVLPGMSAVAQELLDNGTPGQLERRGPWLPWAAGRPLAEVAGNGEPLLDRPALLAVLLRAHDDALLPILLDLGSRHQNAAVAWALAAFDTPEAAEALARLAAADASCIKALGWAVGERPEHGFLALARVLEDGGLPKAGAARLTPLLKTLAGSLGERLSALLAPLSPAVRRLIGAVVDQAGSAPTAFAERDRWPTVLAAPPWMQRPADEQTLVLEGLPMLDVPPEEDWGDEIREHWIARDRPYTLDKPMEAEQAVCERLRGWTPDEVAALHTRPPQDLQRFIADWQQAHDATAPDRRQYGDYVAVAAAWFLPPATGLAFWNAVGSGKPEPRTGGFVARFGPHALPGLLQALANDGDEHFVARFIGAPRIVPFMAQAIARRPTRRADALRWLSRFAQHAVAGLLPAALGTPGEARQQARAALRILAARGQAEAVRTVARRHASTAVPAAVEALLAEDPLQDFPSRIHARSKLPAFWQPAGWRKPRLREDGLPLPDEALHPLGLMLGFAPDSPQGYAGLDDVRAACDPQSLADFAWDVCESWEAAGAGAPGNWALRALGLVGTDDTARRLGALVRRWSAPGSGGTATRIGWVLETLARLGSDVALMQLDAIARKNRIAAVRQTAVEKLAQAATERGLRGDELEDRLAPDLGLDERGSLLLDFGPRQFHVGFDESLVPFVRESVEGRPGARLATAPRPRASDDAELAAAAVARFKALKQDAATVAAQQPLRLERAMGTGRSWPVADFRRFIAEHPLMRHLAERLVWGLAGDGRDARGVPLLHAAFRVNAEGEWVDADEAPRPLDDGSNNDAARIVVAHPMQLSAAQVAAFSQQFSDYELIQPFDQLHRAVHAPHDEERTQTALARWSGRIARPGPLWALESRGWLRGRDGGGAYNHAWRALPGGRTLALRFGPGLHNAGAGEDQTLGLLHYGHPIGELDPIVFSEAVRDIDALGAR
ncbi:DUF4132 domain-containing protein [Variovorax sp. GB1R11]|uniref:DUF4132 domain-containing protein n=1 Tax=Variovorax sp. GB1R11 TaxID=3443741 RepID=UPI003F4825FC